MFCSRTVQNSTKFFQLIHYSKFQICIWNSKYMTGPTKTLVFGSTQTFFLSCRVRNTCKACFVHIRDLSDSVGISCMILVFWLQLLWLEVIFTTVIPCLEVSLFLIFIDSGESRTVFLELLSMPPNIHISLL